MDVIYMCYIVFVMSQMLYIYLLYAMFVNIESKKISLFAECPDPGTRQSWEFCISFAECQGQGTRQRNYEKKYLPSADLAGHSAKKLLKKN